MNIVRTIALTALVTLPGGATIAADQAEHKTHHAASADGTTPTGAPTVAAGDASIKQAMTRMDAQMKAMRAMHEKMSNAKTPEERAALMAEHTKVMRKGMSMMSSMGGSGGMSGMSGPGGMGGKGGMANMSGMAGTSGPGNAGNAGGAGQQSPMPMNEGMANAMAAHHDMMEKRMAMMTAMLQMMMDRLPEAPAK